MKGRVIRGLSLVLAIIIIIMSTDYKILARADQGTANSEETSRIYEGNGYKAKYTLFSSWNSGSNFQIELENTGNTKIENWSILVEYQDEINNIWNAQITSHENGVYTIKNDGWNQDVEVGQTVSFGMSASSAFTAVPASITLLDNYRSVVTEGVIVDYSINNNWGNGCTGSIDISNLTDKTIEDWTVEFDCANSEINFWDGILISHDGNHYEVHNAGYNSAIAPGQSVSVGFLVNGAISDELFTNMKLTEDSDEPETTYPGENDPDEEREVEPLEDIGENYFKQPTEDDIVIDEESGLQYVKNQLLVSAYMGTPKEAIEEMVEEVGADIVGYTEITCDYQIEFRQDMTLDDLDAMAEYLMGYPYVSAVFLNTAMSIAVDGASNDLLYNDGLKCLKKWMDSNGDGDYDDPLDYHYLILKSPSGSVVYDDWNESSPSGDNWGLEALHVPSAWDVATDSHTVKVGIIDNYFENVITPTGKRELVFDDILRNINYSAQNHGLSHGDHVSGIIGATHNNSFGISGVATDVRLYGYTMSESDLDSSVGVSANCMAGVNVALNALICNHVKVINMSLGYGDATLVYGASQGNSKAIRKIDRDVATATEHLRKLTDAGYDFVIVKSAGNFNGRSFVADSSQYGYHEFDSRIDDPAKKENKTVLAEYGFYINAITDPELRDRIIVVGSMNKGNAVSSFSGRGDRVDVLAPGEDIVSTVPRGLDLSAATSAGYAPVIGFKSMDGTSMATPHITGIVSLMYQVKPSLSAKKVKEFIRADARRVRQISGYNVPDAKLCVEYAKSVMDTTAFDEDWPTGLLAASIRDDFGNKISEFAEFHVQAIRHSTGDYNLDKYAFNFSTDVNGDFMYPLPQGTYDVLVYISGISTQYLPTTIKDVEINPDETTYLPTIKLSSWKSRTSGYVKGIVIDAITGLPLDGVTAKIRKGWNATSGAYVANLTGSTPKKATTDLEGTFSISTAIGAYTVELVKEGYITCYYNVLSTPGMAWTHGYDTTMSMTPVLPDDEYRIVLTWGSTPSDLDSHLFYYMNGVAQFHVCYWNQNAYFEGKQVAKLDLDDTSSYGPETITITVDADLVKNGELRYCVHNFSGGYNQLSASNACVRIYRGNELLKDYSITQNRQALVWHVFNINSNGIEMVYTFDDTIN